MPDIAAIDAHAHVGRHTGPEREFVHEWYSGEATDVLRRADAARTRRTAVSTYLAVLRGPAENVLEGNRLGAELAARREGLLLWAVVNPRDPRTFEQADELLASPKCVGVKIHPETHDYTLAGFGDALFAFAAERKALILTHSGDRRSAPEDFIPYADAYPEARLILAHLGDSADGDPTRQVRAIQAARQGNVLTDTSGLASMRSGLLGDRPRTHPLRDGQSVLFRTGPAGAHRPRGDRRRRPAPDSA